MIDKRGRYMREKGFTLNEIVIVLAILAILIGIAIPNFISMKKKADVNSVANQLFAMINDLYEKMDSEMEYDKYFIKIDDYLIPDPTTGENTLKIWLIKFESGSTPQEIILKKIESKTVILNSSLIVRLSTPTYITFDNVGRLRRFTDSISHPASEVLLTDPQTIEVVPKDGGSYKKTIKIRTFPPGSVSIQ